jgi:hypothetical protein
VRASARTNTRELQAEHGIPPPVGAPQSPALPGQRLLERASDRTLPVIQVAPRTLQDSLFALKIQGKAVFLFYIGGKKDGTY